MLRHTLATLAYRGNKAVSGVGQNFANFSAGPRIRTPNQILAHIGDLLCWAVGLTDGKHEWYDSEPLPWDREVGRFFAALKALDRRVAADIPLGFSAEKMGVALMLDKSS